MALHTMLSDGVGTGRSRVLSRVPRSLRFLQGAGVGSPMRPCSSVVSSLYHHSSVLAPSPLASTSGSYSTPIAPVPELVSALPDCDACSAASQSACAPTRRRSHRISPATHAALVPQTRRAARPPCAAAAEPVARNVIMPEHFHLLISEPQVGNPSTVLQVVKQRFPR